MEPERGHLITDVHYGRSADAAMRERRYLITMGVRVTCFLLGVIVPGPMRWVFFGLAAVLPGVAVILANNVDKRSSTLPDEPDLSRPALPSAEIIPGDVDDDEQ